jgi:hypothetical protein
VGFVTHPVRHNAKSAAQVPAILFLFIFLDFHIITASITKLPQAHDPAVNVAIVDAECSFWSKIDTSGWAQAPEKNAIF